MSETFARAAAAVSKRNDWLSWSALTQSERADLIYAKMRKIDAESAKGWMTTGTERNVA